MDLPPVRPGIPLRDAPGHVFRPTDEDLVVYYLRRYLSGQPVPEGTVVEADVYGTEPWNLPLDCREEGYFFAHRTRRSVNSKWPSRIAGGGSWQILRGEEEIKSDVDGRGHVTVGIKNRLTYKHGEQKSGWAMYEFELFDPENFQQDVICYIKKTLQAKKKETKKDQQAAALRKHKRYREEQGNSN